MTRETMDDTTLVFVYNADSGLFNTLSDMAHKTFAPETYSCNLCAITYGAFGMRQEWKQFLESLGINMEFLHRNELFERYAIENVDLPAIFLKKSDALEVWLTAARINACGSMSDLKHLIIGRIEQMQPVSSKNS
jgi:hypothetical protein